MAVVTICVHIYCAASGKYSWESSKTCSVFTNWWHFLFRVADPWIITVYTKSSHLDPTYISCQIATFLLGISKKKLFVLLAWNPDYYPTNPTPDPKWLNQGPNVSTCDPNFLSQNSFSPVWDPDFPTRDPYCLAEDPNCPTWDPNFPSQDWFCPTGDPKCPARDPNCPTGDPNCPTRDTNCPNWDPNCPT